MCRTHSDTTLSMLRRGGGVSKEEESVLAPWEWNHNEAFLHWDEKVNTFWFILLENEADDIANACQKKGIFR